MRKRLILALSLALLCSCVTKPCDLDTLYRASSACIEPFCSTPMPSDGSEAKASPHANFEEAEINNGYFDPYRSVVYEPRSPQPQKAPVIFFLHGYFDATPEPYETMLRHFTRQGFIVIYPSYGHFLNPKAWAHNAEVALARALKYLDSPGHVKPDLERVAFVGHSMGGILALHLAQRIAASPAPGVPQPRLIVSLDGAGISTVAYPFVSIDDLSLIPASTWLLLVVAEESYRLRLDDPQHCHANEKHPKLVCNAFGVDRVAFLETPQIPLLQKAAVMIPSRMQGTEKLRSDHNAVQGSCGLFSKPINAIDTLGYWKLTMGALSHVLRNETADAANFEGLPNRAAKNWSRNLDGIPVVALEQCLESGDCPK